MNLLNKLRDYLIPKDADGASMNSLRKYLKPKPPIKSLVLLIAGGIALLCFSLMANSETVLFLSICAMIVPTVSTVNEHNDYEVRKNTYDVFINRLTKVYGEETLERDFNCSIELTETARLGREFVYFVKAAAIYHVSEIESAALRCEDHSDAENTTTSYFVKLQVNIDGHTYTPLLNVDPDRWHLHGNGSKQYEVAERINRWAADWHNAHPDHKSENA